MANVRKRAENPEIVKGKEPANKTKIRLDASSLKSVYANVFNVGSSREEIALFIGMGQISLANRKELKIRLTDRIVMNPFAAKRLCTMLGRAIRDYEFRFGPLDNLKSSRRESSTTH
jgi:hypothetical protein